MGGVMTETPWCEIKLGVFNYRFEFKSFADLDNEMARFKNDVLNSCQMLLPILGSRENGGLVTTISEPSHNRHNGNDEPAEEPIPHSVKSPRVCRPRVDYTCRKCGQSGLMGLSAFHMHNVRRHSGGSRDGFETASGKECPAAIVRQPTKQRSRLCQPTILVVGVLVTNQDVIRKALAGKATVIFGASNEVEPGKLAEADCVCLMKFATAWYAPVNAAKSKDKIIVANDAQDAIVKLNVVLSSPMEAVLS
jgi:hypothetical protein